MCVCVCVCLCVRVGGRRGEAGEGAKAKAKARARESEFRKIKGSDDTRDTLQPLDPSKTVVLIKCDMHTLDVVH